MKKPTEGRPAELPYIIHRKDVKRLMGLSTYQMDKLEAAGEIAAFPTGANLLAYKRDDILAMIDRLPRKELFPLRKNWDTPKVRARQQARKQHAVA